MSDYERNRTRSRLEAHIRAWHTNQPHSSGLSTGALHRWHRDEHTVRADQQSHEHATEGGWRSGEGTVPHHDGA